MRGKSGLEYLKSPAKRRLDLIGGATIAAALLPAEAVAAAVSAVDTGSNPFLRQSRVGRGGDDIQIIKLRTMPKTQAGEDPEFFSTYDHRSSLTGRTLREIGIDEAPQLLHVIKGDMSLVGMRPLTRKAIDQLEDISPPLFRKWYPLYTELRPSVTGPSQIYRHRFRWHTPEVLAESMRLDLEYIRSASLRNDLRILGSTPLQLLKARIQMVDNSAEVPDSSAILAPNS